MTERTVTPRRTKARAAVAKQHEAALSAYAEVNDEFQTLARERKRLRGVVDMIPVGRYGEWEKAFGTASKTTDMDAVAARYEQLGEMLPKKDKEPPLQVKHIV